MRGVPRRRERLRGWKSDSEFFLYLVIGFENTCLTLGSAHKI
jgi:hypothetical protein